MKKLDLTLTNQKLRLLAYGVAGSGKTTFVGSAALDNRSAPVLHIDCSGNPESLLRITPDPLELPDVLLLEKLSDLSPIYDWFVKGQPKGHSVCNAYGLEPGYRTLVFDGITAIQRRTFALAQGLPENKPGEIPQKPEWGHYNQVLGYMIQFATLFYKLSDLHILITALERVSKRYVVPGDEKTSYPYIEPGLSGQSKREFPGEALAVLRFSHKSQLDGALVKDLEKQRSNAEPIYSIAQFRPSQSVYCKDQHGFNLSFLANPTVSALLDRLARKATA